MNRRPPSFRSLAVAATADAAISDAGMSYRPYLRGGRPHGSRSYSERPFRPASGQLGEFVSGDSHFRAVRDANRGFRPSYNAVPPPPQYVTGQQLYGPRSQSYRPGPPVSQQLPGPRPYGHPRQVRPAFGNYQQFRPQQAPQQFRQRAPKPLDYRDWEYAKPGPPHHCERFTVLSYNILADYLATDHWQKLYFHIPRYIMDWNWRKKNITFELGLWSADILCFQEVDRFQDIAAELKPRGYDGIWKMRTGDPADGCAIFWRASRFKLLHEESIEYNKLGLRDNVAQICVFESLNGQNKNNAASTMSPSCTSASSNRVVVCNIHVLFNPKRGDIKLGQIRVLMARAHAVSKLWDDAPVVICGDFNCTPKLDLSELGRDQVSGQASAEIHPSRPSSPDFRTQATNDSAQASTVYSQKRQEPELPLDAQKLIHPRGSPDASSTGSYSEPGCSVVGDSPESCIKRSNESPSHDTADSCSSKSILAPCVQHDVLNGSLSSAEDNAVSPIQPAMGTNEVTLMESSSEDIHSYETELREHVESNLQTLYEAQDNEIKPLCSPDNHSNDLTKTSESKGTFDSNKSQLKGPSEKLFPNSHGVTSSKFLGVALSVSAVNNHGNSSYSSTSCESVSADFILDEKFGDLSLNITDGVTHKLSEDSDSFLSELHSTGQSPFPADLDNSSPGQKLHSRGGDILNENSNVQNDIIFHVENSSYNPSAWTPAETQLATGSAECKIMEHPLKLTSAYAEVENSSGLRDSRGEPLVTSYHRRFSGTVDYIWHSEGLQTAKVLAPIPKHVMQQTRGFPTKKWGSDHIALVSEFAFTKDISEKPS
ncbi:Carbon catabolite repressor protein 46 [Sesamum alatum]|uniref:Carbon catabolite repressor protein 46 n=1 Tax=Sesamum alatum TaxID=300844 RepID=A0AAE1YTI2_9LAMI|nr:Carbon catabolite repressor protein 46 [Sesamum alatum]